MWLAAAAVLKAAPVPPAVAAVLQTAPVRVLPRMQLAAVLIGFPHDCPTVLEKCNPVEWHVPLEAAGELAVGQLNQPVVQPQAPGLRAAFPALRLLGFQKADLPLGLVKSIVVRQLLKYLLCLSSSVSG